MFAFFLAPMGYQKAKNLGLTYEQMKALMKVRDKLSRQEYADFSMKTWGCCIAAQMNKELSVSNRMRIPYLVDDEDKHSIALRRLFNTFDELSSRDQLLAAERINSFLAGGESCPTDPPIVHLT